jgi:protein import protein ZIM17
MFIGTQFMYPLLPVSTGSSINEKVPCRVSALTFSGPCSVEQNSCPASLNGPCFTLPARGRLRGADASAVCLQARAAGGDKGDTSDSGSSRGSGGARGFGKPHGKAVESGFSKAKKERPNEYPQMQAVFTCGWCDVRQSKVFTRMAYEQGVVVVKCNGCGVQHIMADNLGYFEDMTGKRAVNVEDLLLAKGERVDNRLSEAGVGELKLADATDREDGTIEVRPKAPSCLTPQRPQRPFPEQQHKR